MLLEMKISISQITSTVENLTNKVDHRNDRLSGLKDKVKELVQVHSLKDNYIYF